MIYDVRAKPRNIASLTGTKDLQMVSYMTPTRYSSGLGTDSAGQHHLSCSVPAIGCRSSYHVRNLPASLLLSLAAVATVKSMSVYLIMRNTYISKILI